MPVVHVGVVGMPVRHRLVDVLVGVRLALGGVRIVAVVVVLVVGVGVRVLEPLVSVRVTGAAHAI